MRIGTKRTVMLALLATAVIAVGAFASFAVPRWQAERRPELPPQTHVASIGDIEDVISAIGTLQPRDSVDVGAQVSGQLRAIHVAIGKEVEAGDLLAEIDPTVLIAKVEAGKAQLAALRAQLIDKQSQAKLAASAFERQARMRRDRATSDEAYENAEHAARSAAAQVDMLQAQISQIESTLRGDEATLGYTKIHAPMSGTVVLLPARQGQTLIASQQAPLLLRIADLSTMTVLTQVSEADVPRLKLGMEAYFTTLGQPLRRWYGHLRQILPTPEVVNNVVLYTALFDVANESQLLMAQMTAQVSFVVSDARKVVIVPVNTVRRIGQKATVTVVVNGVAQSREVETGIANRQFVEVRRGIQPGERVVVRPPSRPPGMRPPIAMQKSVPK